jgi:hypothetical protein
MVRDIYAVPVYNTMTLSIYRMLNVLNEMPTIIFHGSGRVGLRVDRVGFRAKIDPIPKCIEL